MNSEFSILQEAYNLVKGSRAATHGDFKDNFKVAAGIFNAWTGNKLTPAEVSMVLQALKMAREVSNPFNRDNYVDQVGYTELRYKLIYDQRMADSLDTDKAK